MARAPQPTDFVVQVEGIGPFTFAKRTFRVDMAARAEFARLTEGMASSMSADERLFCDMASDLKTMIVDAPSGWTADDIDNLDPYDIAAVGALTKVWSALRDKESAFRAKPVPGLQGQGEKAPGDDGVLVPAEIQPGADRPTVS